MDNYLVRFTDGSEITCHAVTEQDYGIILQDCDGDELGFVPTSVLADVVLLEE